jgi:hypothetical protein
VADRHDAVHHDVMSAAHNNAASTPMLPNRRPDLWHGPLSLPAAMPAGRGLAAMRHSGQRCALVVASGQPFALVTEDHLASLPPDQAIGDRVEWEVLRVPADADETQTVRLHTEAAWRWLRRRRMDRPHRLSS